jgi:hypothetical protein
MTTEMMTQTPTFASETQRLAGLSPDAIKNRIAQYQNARSAYIGGYKDWTNGGRWVTTGESHPTARKYEIRILAASRVLGRN